MNNKPEKPNQSIIPPPLAEPLDWWFIQGEFSTAAGITNRFLCCLFRYRADSGNRRLRDHYSLLLANRRTDAPNQAFRSQITTGLHRHFLERIRKWRPQGFDPELIRVFAAELAESGPPASIRIEKTPISFRNHPLSVIWDDFSLTTAPDGFDLTFIVPDTGLPCRLHLGNSDSIQGPISNVLFGRNIGYWSHPRLKVTGEYGSDPVSGMAWFEYQGQNLRPLFRMEKKPMQILGWEWLAVNLDDGSDLMLFSQRLMKSGRTVNRSGFLRRPGAAPIWFDDFISKPLRHWESPETHCRYPTSWEFFLPGLDGTIRFEPEIDHQEIPVYGLIRAIWEGAGLVSGTIAGRPVSGRARLELQGYGFLFSLTAYLEQQKKRIDRNIAAYFPTHFTRPHLQRFVGTIEWEDDPEAHTQILSQPVWNLLKRSGKQWRPLFGFLLLESLGTDSVPYEMLLTVASELSHTGSLIIDDIEDDSLLRRGRECIHRLYGLDVAINAANTLYFLPFLILETHPGLDDHQRLGMHQSYVRKFVRSHFGQGLDIYWSREINRENLDRWNRDSLGAKILQMYTYKTSALIEGGVDFACIIARTDKRTRRACRDLARNFGVAFQITDDIHNFSESPRWRKHFAEDLLEGKLTYVIFRAMQKLPDPECKRLQEILVDRDMRRDPKIVREGADLIIGSGALRECRAEALSMFETSWKRFSRVVKPSDPKMILRLICTHLLHLDFQTAPGNGH